MKPFGYSYLIDLYECEVGACDSLELHYRFLEKMIHLLGMHKMAAPVVLHAPVKFDWEGNYTEIYPEKAGVSCWCPLIESGIQGHSLEPSRFSSWDFYSCKEFDIEVVKKFTINTFKCKRIEDNFIVRGKNFDG